MKQLPSYNEHVFNEVLISIIRKSLVSLEPVPVDTVAASAADPSEIPGIKAVLFDIYGTLLISESGDISLADSGFKRRRRVKAAGSALSNSGFELLKSTSAEKALDAFHDEIELEHARLKAAGVDFPEVEIRAIWKNVILRLKKEKVLSGKADEAASSIVALRFELATNRIWPMPGAEVLLNRVKRAGIPAGIVSNAQFYTPLTFQALFSKDEEELGFDRDLIAYSYMLHRAKPSPGIFQPILERLENERGITAGQVLYIGNDMRNDVYTAQLCGCKAILFAGDQRSLRLRRDHPECINRKPDAVVTGLDQIPSLLGIDSHIRS
jgi:putative hydrolase of the HAD superfamily